MNDIDYLKDDVDCLRRKIEEFQDDFPYYLYGVYGSEEKLIAVFSTEGQMDLFINSCYVKIKSGKNKGQTKYPREFNKKSPLNGFSYATMKRYAIPNNIPCDPPEWEDNG